MRLSVDCTYFSGKLKDGETHHPDFINSMSNGGIGEGDTSMNDRKDEKVKLKKLSKHLWDVALPKDS